MRRFSMKGPQTRIILYSETTTTTKTQKRGRKSSTKTRTTTTSLAPSSTVVSAATARRSIGRLHLLLMASFLLLSMMTARRPARSSSCWLVADAFSTRTILATRRSFTSTKTTTTTTTMRWPRQNVKFSAPRPSYYRRHNSFFSALQSYIGDDEQDYSSSSSQDETAKKKQQQQSLQSLQDRIAQYNQGIPINVQSPKQVSLAIFGRPQSAAKSILQQAMTNEDLPPEKRQLAHLILHCRELLKQQQPSQPLQSQSQSQSQPFSTTDSTTISVFADDTDDEEESDDLQEDTLTATDKSSPISSAVSISERSIASSNSTFTSNAAKKAGGHHHRHQPTHEQIVDSLFDRPRSQLDDYWRDPLKRVSRPVARDLLKQLDPTECPMAFDPAATPNNSRRSAAITTTTSTAGKKGSFLAFCREQKRLYPQCVILTRMGDFYETFGIDAILLVEHVGLNPMGGKVKAGCPYRNVQATLNGLTEQGFSVAVYEEVGQTSSNKLKTRVLSQIVSPASPTYLYDHNWLLGSGGSSGQDSGGTAFLDQLPASRPCVGIVHTAAGYHMMEVSLEERSVEYSERLTPEAVACRLAAYPPAEPLVYIPSPSESAAKTMSRLPFLPHPSRPSTKAEREMVEAHLGGFRVRTIILPPQFIPTTDGSESERYISVIVDTLLHWNEKRAQEEEDDDDDDDDERQNGRRQELTAASRRPGASIPEQRRVTPKDFTVSQLSASTTNPLYLETASQLGLLQDPAIPSLIFHVLDEAAPAATRRFLKRYLLVPPPPQVAQAMAQVVRSLRDEENTSDSNSMVALPRLTVPPLGKVLSLIRAGQASAAIYGELLHTLAVTRFVVLSKNRHHDLPVDALLTLCSHESGLVAERDSLLLRCQQAMDVIEAVICPSHHVDDGMLLFDDNASSLNFSLEDPLTHYQYLPDAFVERNELPWRGRVQREVAEEVYQRVEDAGRHLDAIIARDFIQEDNSNRGLIANDIFNNLLVLKKVPTSGNAKDYIQPRDRHGKKLATRFTTEDVQQALSDYVVACDKASEEISTILSNLAKTLQDDGHIPAIIQSAHLNLALSAAYHHAVKAIKNGWHLAEIVDPSESDNSNDNDASAKFVGLWPYWMSRSQAVPNTFDLNGMFLLTAPNMSGKSTIMRSTAAAALLTVCGLCAPLLEGSRIPRFDTLFLRGASADVPAENKSAFGAEMEDIAALMRCCGPRSMVFVDEIGRGTSPRDGARLAAAILEAMATRGMQGIFATHLHDILNLPLEGRERILTKQMAISRFGDDGNENNDNFYEWTYRLEDGVCNDSLAMVTAARFGLPDEIIQRADELDQYLSHHSVVTPDADHTSSGRHTVPINGSRQEDYNDFQKAISLAEEIVFGQTSSSTILIPPQANPPPALANQSCVYLLELGCDPPRYYVGETDSLFQRLQSHRNKGPAWSSCTAAVLPVSSKSDARRLESRLIQRLAQAGFPLESIYDGRTYRQ